MGQTLKSPFEVEEMGSVQRQAGHLRLFVTHRRELLNYANDIVDDRSHAEDVLQDAYVRFAAVARSRALEEPLGYLFRIVRNIALDGRRRQVRQGRYVVEQTEDQLLAADERPSPETETHDRRQLQRVREALDELPSRTRIAVELHRLEGLKTREVAERLGVSTTLAHGLITDGVAHCRRRLARVA